jgi:hypothetical protein
MGDAKKWPLFAPGESCSELGGIPRPIDCTMASSSLLRLLSFRLPGLDVRKVGTKGAIGSPKVPLRIPKTAGFLAQHALLMWADRPGPRASSAP